MTAARISETICIRSTQIIQRILEEIISTLPGGDMDNWPEPQDDDNQ